MGGWGGGDTVTSELKRITWLQRTNNGVSQTCPFPGCCILSQTSDFEPLPTSSAHTRMNLIILNEVIMFSFNNTLHLLTVAVNVRRSLH